MSHRYSIFVQLLEECVWVKSVWNFVVFYVCCGWALDEMKGTDIGVWTFIFRIYHGNILSLLFLSIISDYNVLYPN